MIIETLSVFPQVFDGPSSAMGTSIVGRARSAGILTLINHDLRNWTHDRHRSVDDQPFGGGQGQLMKVEPVFEALDDLIVERPAERSTEVIFLAPFGQRFDQSLALELAAASRLLLVCGRYEGFDDRVYSRADRVISLGDFILTGGELAAMCVIDAVCRLIPGALGDELSSVDESFSQGLLEYPQYTRPAEYRGMGVPEVLLSGHHALIRRWRREQSIIRTAQLRPDLLTGADLSESEHDQLRLGNGKGIKADG
ncbi:MAG: tRNA (guanosine(37)-N1)-methyltransferase TrmD [Actinomycetia bacterium]|nr:tRNA (guanosine(37)-N1)-methyltransferase TrmD [Actinomycetes bacterium]